MKTKIRTFAILCLTVVFAMGVAACGQPAADKGTVEQVTAPSAVETTEQAASPSSVETTGQTELSFPCPITEFGMVENADRLSSDMEAGTVPKECRVLYDEMGSRPEVILTDPDMIAQIYELLSDITVTGPSEYSITDCYHHVDFTLQDGTQTRFHFEGEELLSFDRENFDVSGGDKLWAMIRSLQEEIMEE